MILFNLLLNCLALSSAVTARRIFYSPGRLNNWNLVRVDHYGAVFELNQAADAYKGENALKISQEYDASYNGLYHTEVDYYNGYRRGQDRFYGFMFRLPENWEFTNQTYNIARFVSRRNTGCEDGDGNSGSMFWIRGNQLMSHIVSGTYQLPSCRRSVTPLNNLATITAGVWHKVIIQAKWRSDDRGLFRIWFDGVKVAEKLNTATTYRDYGWYQFSIGVYANGWHDDGGVIGSQIIRPIWYDEISIGTEMKDVDPDY